MPHCPTCFLKGTERTSRTRSPRAGKRINWRMMWTTIPPPNEITNPFLTKILQCWGGIVEDVTSLQHHRTKRRRSREVDHQLQRSREMKSSNEEKHFCLPKYLHVLDHNQWMKRDRRCVRSFLSSSDIIIWQCPQDQTCVQSNVQDYANGEH